MPGSVNKVILVANLGRDPEERSFSNGGKVVNMTVATSERWKDKASGESKEKTEWTRVAIMDEKLCDVATRFLKKGSKVYLEGQLETRKYTDQSGAEKYSTEVVLRPYRGVLTLLDSAGGGGDGERSGGQKPAARGGSTGGGGWAKDDDLNDSIPFGPEWR